MRGLCPRYHLAGRRRTGTTVGFCSGRSNTMRAQRASENARLQQASLATGRLHVFGKHARRVEDRENHDNVLEAFVHDAIRPSHEFS